MTRPSWLRQRLLAMVMAVAAMLAATPAAAQVASVAYDDVAAVLERIDEIMLVLDDARNAIDRTAFDADELAFEFAFDDAATISAWVRDEILFQPYAGVLRGADGTLRARAGNAFDQALLLARLLNDAGYETRIAVADLAEDEALRLLSRATSDEPAMPPIGDEAALRAALTRLVELTGGEEGDLLDSLEATLSPEPLTDGTLLAEVGTIADGILRLLDEEGVAIAHDARARLVDESTRYAWTEFRLGPGDPWTAAHPTGFEPSDALAAVETFSDVIPETYLHRVRLEAWIEAKAGGTLTIQPVMAAWDRPVSNAEHIVIDYANAPDPAPIGDTLAEFDLEALADGAQAFMPNLFGELAEDALIFDLDGRVLAPDVAGSAAAGVFRSLAGNAEGAVGVLGTIGTDDDEADDVLALTGHGLDITVIAPDGTETTYRRWIVDRLGPEAREAGETTVSTDPEERVRVARALVGRHRIMVSTGAVTPAYLLDRAIDRLLETRPWFEFVASILDSDLAEVEIDPEVVPRPAGIDQLGTLESFERALADLDAGAGYRPGPAVIVFNETVTEDAGGFRLSVDIVANPRRVLVDGDEGPGLDAGAAVRRGAWETMVERQVLSTTEADLSAGDVTESVAAADLRGPYTLLRPGDEPVAADLGIEPTTAARIADDLARGSIVLLGTLPESGEHAWWRVDPASGTTLGITQDGRGQAVVEYTINLVDSIATIAFAVKGLGDCYGQPSGPAQACCLVKAHVNNVMGFGFGGAVGAAFSSGAGLAFGLTTSAAGVDWAGGLTGLDCEAFGDF